MIYFQNSVSVKNQEPQGSNYLNGSATYVARSSLKKKLEGMFSKLVLPCWATA